MMMASVSFATIHNVTLSGISFNPASLTIQQGDTVRWTNQGGFHNVAEVSNPPVFRSGDPSGTNFTYQFVFAAPLIGAYSYICEVHAPSMAGTVTVQAAGNPPDAPTYLGPQNGSTGRPLNGTLSWNPASGADHYIVRLGTSNPPAIVDNMFSGTVYNYTNLTPGTQYFWQAISENEFGQAEGNVWSFTTITPPAQATNPFPANGATNVPITTILGWDAADGAASYEVFIGTGEPLGSVGVTSETTLSLSEDLLHETTYQWRVNSINDAGTTTGMTWSFTTEAGSAADDAIVPVSFSLGQAYPNPFNSSVRIALNVAQESQTSVRIFDILGQEVSKLVDSRLTAGQHTLEWNAAGQSAGLYFLRCEYAGVTQTQKLIYLP